MKNHLSKAFICLVIPVLFSCKVNAQRKVYENIKGFTSLSISSGIEVFLTQGKSESVEIEGNDKVFDDLVVEVDNGTLIVKANVDFLHWFSNQGPIKAYISFKDLDEISLSGGCNLKGQGDFNFKRLKVQASGGSDLNMALRANNLTVQTSGGSDVTLAGYAAKFKGSASGGSDLKAEQLETEEAEISSSGGADVDIRVNKKLTASASGGSDVYYYGNPEEVNKNESGGSDVLKK